ncbi:MAG: 23S rRNA (pseudouridine(1915)-N(3))-methyltransferase RlmH [Oligoflexia bacterium]|nr:23S rRNA (pseudouridine(1915)-N(3))-methyltransferase RlmH [Oligoflexia bacterium]
MHAKIISVGRVRQNFVLQGEQEYLVRLKPLLGLELIEVEARAELPEVSMKREEAANASKRIADRDVLVVLDERGKQFSSTQLSAWMANQMNNGKSDFCFAIGGAYGWDEEFKKKAALVLSLSPLTFTYQMTRLILIEQLYRALTIMKGIPYHKA